MFGFKKKIEVEQYDKISPDGCICKLFRKVMLIRNEADKAHFIL